MHKFSIIIPTIWKSEYIHEMLDKYYECQNIDEVILINNNRINTPNFTRHKKLLYIEPNDNIYVNPAWNMGVRVSKNNNLIIANDDIKYDVIEFTSILSFIIDKFQGLENAGMIGMDYENYKLQDRLDLVQIKAHQGKPAWACLFSTHKNNWRIIPEQLKIWYGDNFIKSASGNKIFDLVGFKIESKMSTSADTDVDWVKTITDEDKIEWDKIVSKIY